jgi:hypothetical protein
MLAAADERLTGGRTDGEADLFEDAGGGGERAGRCATSIRKGSMAAAGSCRVVKSPCVRAW